MRFGHNRAKGPSKIDRAADDDDAVCGRCLGGGRLMGPRVALATTTAGSDSGSGAAVAAGLLRVELSVRIGSVRTGSARALSGCSLSSGPVLCSRRVPN